MEEFSISKYQKAPYLELDNYKAPEGINSYFVNMDDGIKIRVCHWLQKKEKSIGTILLQQGHNEFIEKYYETIQEFIDRGYSVICFDWRGQGMSDRMIDDINKSFINDFKRHDKDLEKILGEIIDPFFPKPLIEIDNKPMIQWVIESLNFKANFIFIIQKEHQDKYNIKSVLKILQPNCKIIELDHLTEGAACTTLLAKKFINNSDPLIIANSDLSLSPTSLNFLSARLFS